MASKRRPHTPPPEENALPQSLRESAQQIWMAGLSAFAKAQSGGNKVFEALMKEGESLQSRTRQAARDQVDDMAEKASGTWDRLEQVFETRVASALHSLGVPTHDDIEQLTRRVAELSALVDGLQSGRSQATGARSARVAAKPEAKTRAKAGPKVAPKAAPKATPQAAASTTAQASATPTSKSASKKPATKRPAQAPRSASRQKAAD